ncbi:MAG: glycosyltransferase [Candidatus Omnitrophica bacterium]|nr:glycosyltransferase [Candidatus Omnitrophota bacterium]
MPDTPFISIIVPVRNFERTINKTFEYLLNVKYPHDCWEIVIADGGSTDNTLNIVRSWQKDHPFIKLVEIPNCPSPAYARNRALEVVKGDFIFFTDGDCAPCQDWINIMLKHFERDEKIGIVGGEIYTLRVDKDNLTETYCEHFKFNMVAPRYGFINEGYFPELTDKRPTQIAGHRAYFFVTANVAYRKRALDETNAKFWDKPTGEDIDLCVQVRNKGWKLYFAPDAKVDHMHRANFKALRKVWVTYGMAHPPLIKKHAADSMEIVIQFLGKYPKNPVIAFASPVKGFIYIGNFHLMHIFGILSIIGGLLLFSMGHILWLRIATLISLLLTLRTLKSFCHWCWFMMPRKYFFVWCWMKYRTNWSFIVGGLKGSVKNKTFCIEPSF